MLAPLVDAGRTYDVEVTDVTGGDEGRSLGVNVLVSRRGAAETEAASVEQACQTACGACIHDARESSTPNSRGCSSATVGFILRRRRRSRISPKATTRCW